MFFRSISFTARFHQNQTTEVLQYKLLKQNISKNCGAPVSEEAISEEVHLAEEYLFLSKMLKTKLRKRATCDKSLNRN